MIEKFINALWSILYIFIGWVLGLLSVEFNFRRTRELEKKKILQVKVEELVKLMYELSDEYTQISSEILAYTEVGKEINLKGINANTLLFIRTLITFYFPELKTLYEELEGKKKEFSEMIVSWLKKDQAFRKEIAAEIFVKSKEIDKVCEKVISSSTTIAQRLL